MCVHSQFMNELLSVAVLSNTPSVGSYIALDHDGRHPSDFQQGISWFCSKVIEVSGDQYKVDYDDGSRWYTFKRFNEPKIGPSGGIIYGAIE